MSIQPTRKLAFLCYPQFQSLDLSGPMEVFAQANKHTDIKYEIHILSESGGLNAATSGMQVVTEKFCSLAGFDSLIMLGGDGVHQVCENNEYIAYLQEQSGKVQRIISVCSGSLALAKAGLLNGRRATSHWGQVERLASYGQNIVVDPDAIYVRDGNVYTSAGVTTGMDLALSLVEDDHGRNIAMKIAKNLVVFYLRQGGQSQYSEPLKIQSLENDGIRKLCDFIRDNISAQLDVMTLAQRINMSERNFSRIFTKTVGCSPGKFVEQVRLDAARLHLENSRHSLDKIAQLSGFSSAEILRRVFYRQLNVSPAEYRQRFGKLDHKRK